MDNFKHLKENIDITSLIPKLVKTPIKIIGDSTDLNCPFCNHKNCFRLSKYKQIFKCFSCGLSGDIHIFIQKYYGLNKFDALKKLSEITQIKINIPKKTTENNIMDSIVNYYHYILTTNKEALNYQTQTRKHSIDTIRNMKVGYTSGRLFKFLQRSFPDNEILSTGLVMRSKDGKYFYDYFPANVYIYPHMIGNEYGNFTIKDPNKKYSHRLKNDFKHQDCIFYNMNAYYEDHEHLIITEGEDDLLSIMDAGYQNVVALSGNISNKQVELLKQWYKNDNDQLITCFDNDDAGIKYTKKLQYHIQSYVPALRDEIIHPVIKTIQLPKNNDIDDVLKISPDKKQSMKQLISCAQYHYVPLKTQLIQYYLLQDEKDNKPDPQKIGLIVAQYLSNYGKFLIDSERCKLYFENQIYTISDNNPWNPMLNRVAGLNAQERNHKIIRQEINDYAYNFGEKLHLPGWTYTHHETNNNLINLCNEQNEIILLGPKHISLHQNANNPYNVLLDTSDIVQPIKYNPDAKIDESISMFNRLIIENCACSKEDRMYYACFLINSYLLNYSKHRCILQLQGNPDSGKSTAAELSTMLIYGSEQKTTATSAALFSEAAKNALIVLDNKEKSNISKAEEDFLIYSATGITRKKRKRNTDDENINEKINCQVIVTSVEPFENDDVLNRTYNIQFDRNKYGSSFIPSTIMNKIKTNRDDILSGIFKLIALHILPDFETKRLKAYEWINKYFANHSKRRFNEYLAGMLVICKELCKHIPYNLDSPNDQHLLLFNDWIKKQDARSRQTKINTNDVIQFIELLVDDFLKDKELFRGMNPEIVANETMIDFNDDLSSISFIFSSAQLLKYFNIQAKNQGIRQPFGKAESLIARIRAAANDNSLSAVNWTYESNIRRGKRGVRLHRLTKSFVPEKEITENDEY